MAVPALPNASSWHRASGASPPLRGGVHSNTKKTTTALQGEALFQALESSHALCFELPPPGQKCCFETFPHAITRQLTNGNTRGTNKRVQRRTLLGLAGIDLGHLTNLDLVDAALCALTAYHVATGRECVCYGESESGFIIVPKSLNSGTKPAPERNVSIPPSRRQGGAGSSGVSHHARPHRRLRAGSCIGATNSPIARVEEIAAAAGR